MASVPLNDFLEKTKVQGQKSETAATGWRWEGGLTTNGTKELLRVVTIFYVFISIVVI